MNHSQMLTARRKKQKTRKQLAKLAKRAKKLGKQNAKGIGANAPNEGRP
jgi:hypothetical protein